MSNDLKRSVARILASKNNEIVSLNDIVIFNEAYYPGGKITASVRHKGKIYTFNHDVTSAPSLTEDEADWDVCPTCAHKRQINDINDGKDLVKVECVECFRTGLIPLETIEGSELTLAQTIRINWLKVRP